ncbi:TIGR03667 family PPOX class F420-dependent oxidoreductase [Cellulosimicrobium arenosum]|uniref:TIGR03667 family PPOX class F420-dependent oxidoreductase n=1 Tax=Cellulosimicrobium arenosum TaxID=2708133 RepID=A0A927G9T5_9MICO|nr:TIGR03667 family PPOX class F420-dependent oxidoreductase [Cellulosimicrobium arenosum]MBD8079323.1 TIGR03667 family PPOX class F420-dependent oxidoreductase [Cellulosimicrobium arenosum]
MSVVDRSTEHGRRAAERLSADQVVWFVSVDPHGTPQPTPVWFWWDEGTGELVVQSQPRTAKLRNVRAQPRVAVHLNSTPGGGDVVVLTGSARIDDAGLTSDERSAYDGKYAVGLRGLNMTADDFHADYSVTVRITPERVRGF